MKDTVLKTKLTERQEGCRRKDVTVSSSMVDVLDIAIGHVLAPAAGDVSSNDPLLLDAEMPEEQMNYRLLGAQLTCMNSESNTWRSLARERGNDIIDLWAPLDTSEEKFELLKSQNAVV